MDSVSSGSVHVGTKWLGHEIGAFGADGDRLAELEQLMVTEWLRARRIAGVFVLLCRMGDPRKFSKQLASSS
jgi:hypothetical protein